MLKDNIAKKLSEVPGLTRNILASKAGITQASFSHIMTGKVKNPGIHIVAKIAKELNCSIDELIGRSAYVSKKPTKVAEEMEFKPDLALSSIVTVLDLLEATKHYVSFETLLEMAASVYRYSVGKNSNSVDEYFARWFIEYHSRL